ncbi:MAG TPA: ABC transporter permease [Chromatiaceae bacterium]|jgi:peptide/nickel transport system permease protein|nr:ABC transporter permease [Chromatiaceae bacterium]HIN81857.1 ABC transporter permease [Chromatiales bacterium]HIA08306.1 ABC transporter permease [Chromatiaceae bacterium]HIB83502.1 ABC transporter permease [Chromatiaceae bacterium]HIO13877.1 ABC transporter permease [Chromatiales bacterium]
MSLRNVPLRVSIPLLVLLVWVGVVLLVPVLPLDPESINLQRILQGPQWTGWLGYDDLGRSVLDRVVEGGQTSLIVALLVVGITALTGTFIGLVSGYVGGVVDLLIMRIVDVFLAFPGILLAIALAAVLGPGIDNVVFALSVVGWVGYARLARAQVLSLKSRDHVAAAVALGVGRIPLMLRHLLPLMMAPLIVEATFGFASVVIAEAGLSFLGLGVQPPEASWGSMIRDGARYLLMAPHLVIAPGIALMLVVLCVNLLGDSLRDALDVRATPSRNE